MTTDVPNTCSLQYVFIPWCLLGSGRILLYVYFTPVRKFYSLIRVVSLKMCGLDTVNGILGMGCGFGPVLYRSEFNLRYTEFALSSWVKHLRREAVHTPPPRNEVKNERNYISTHLHTGI
jgi:hypothetical protein